MYGEIHFDSFCIALERIRHKYGKPGVGATPVQGIMQGPGGAFFDIGCGTGKPLVAAACIHPFDTLGGVEILEGLHSVSTELIERFESHGRALLFGMAVLLRVLRLNIRFGSG